MDMSVNSIYKCVWQLLNLLVNLYKVCIWLRLRVIAFALWSYDLCQTKAKRKQNEYEFLKQCTRQLNKIPRHLNLIIGPKAQYVNEELLARIFTFALYVNIECVSYYDTRLNNTSGNVKRIALNKINCPEGWRSKSLDDHRAVWHDSNNEPVQHNGSIHKNGYVTKNLPNNCSNGHITSSPTARENKCIEIYEIRPDDNRPLIAQVCRDLFRERHSTEIQHLLQKRSQLTDRIDRELAQHLGNLSEPELSIVFHENLCTFGTLPWSIRFTEFHRHETGQRFDVESFARILYKYSRCEQRWGK